ncbi:expressed protein [Phakopsora pachyrhizi]|uniref:Expressed protein n=1 Tax=Phakopsora pachyrhizi TaxID=170000 RepID=A0AAV0AMZ0_PHAPC|nr:expressed protein [Phakopsora pachyrhizi]
MLAMSDFASGLGEPRIRSPSPGRGGRFDDGGRRSPPLPPPLQERWSGNSMERSASGGPGPSHRGRSPDFGRKRRRDDSPPSRDRYIPNYEREPPRERERRDPPYPPLSHERGVHPNRHGLNSEMFEEPYRRGDGPRDKSFNFSPERGQPGRGTPKNSSAFFFRKKETCFKLGRSQNAYLFYFIFFVIFCIKKSATSRTSI